MEPNWKYGHSFKNSFCLTVVSCNFSRDYCELCWRLKVSFVYLRVSHTVPWGAPQHYFKPRLRERSDWHPPAFSVPAARHCGAGRRCQVEGAPRHHWVHAPVGGTVGESGQRLSPTGNNWLVIKAERVELLCHERISNGGVCVHRAWSSSTRSSTPSAWPGWLTTVSLLRSLNLLKTFSLSFYKGVPACFIYLLFLCPCSIFVIFSELARAFCWYFLSQNNILPCALSDLLAERVCLVALISSVSGVNSLEDGSAHVDASSLTAVSQQRVETLHWEAAPSRPQAQCGFGLELLKVTVG